MATWRCQNCDLLNFQHKKECQACFTSNPNPTATKNSGQKVKAPLTLHTTLVGNIKPSTSYIKGKCYIACKVLNVNKSLLKLLQSKLYEIGNINNDYRKGEPIQNIIDPDLYLFKSYNKQSIYNHKNKYFQTLQDKYDFKLKQKDNNNSNSDSFSCQSYDSQDLTWIYEQEPVWNDEQKQLAKGYLIRGQYQWIATEVNEQIFNKKINIMSNIHNLSPKSQYLNLYNCIEDIFSRMLPLFNNFPIFRERKNQNFQVIVKSQKYEIKDMSGYSGHWHQEGLTENIVLVGLYYFHCDNGLTGGNLKFRSDHMYSCTSDVDHWDEKCEINEGTAIVFNNIDIVHRVTMLKNKKCDNKTRYRSFLAFFIIDPDKHIISTKDICSLKREFYIILISESTNNILTQDIASIICEYGNCGYTLKQAKEMREKDIEIRKNSFTKSRFGYVWGNNGEIFWFKMGKMHTFHNDDVPTNDDGFTCGNFASSTESHLDSALDTSCKFAW